MSKVFLFSDLHCSEKNLKNFYDFILKRKDIKALIFAGDVVNMGEPEWFMDDFIKVIKELKLPFLWTPGNNDFGVVYNKLDSRYKSLESKVVECCSRRFTGVGGSPASWAGQYAGGKMINKKEIAGSIFISHYPPPGILNYQKKDIDSPTSSKNFSDAPIAHICGHLHNIWGTAHLGQTKVIKLASLETNHYAIMDLKNLSVEFGEF